MSGIVHYRGQSPYTDPPNEVPLCAQHVAHPQMTTVYAEVTCRKCLGLCAGGTPTGYWAPRDLAPPKGGPVRPQVHGAIQRPQAVRPPVNDGPTFPPRPYPKRRQEPRQRPADMAPPINPGPLIPPQGPTSPWEAPKGQDDPSPWAQPNPFDSPTIDPMSRVLISRMKGESERDYVLRIERMEAARKALTYPLPLLGPANCLIGITGMWYPVRHIVSIGQPFKDTDRGLSPDPEHYYNGESGDWALGIEVVGLGSRLVGFFPSRAAAIEVRNQFFRVMDSGEYAGS